MGLEFSGASAPRPVARPSVAHDPAPLAAPSAPSAAVPSEPLWPSEAPVVDPSFGDVEVGAPRRGILAQLKDFVFGGPAKIDVRHPVTLFGQPTGMTCWSAAATMLFGDRSIGPGDARLGPSGGLVASAENVQEFARAHDLAYHAPQSWSVDGLATTLEQNGPLWVAGYVPSGHAYVVGGMKGDGTPAGTKLTIHDPWPPGRGKTYDVNYADWMQRNPEGTTYVLHR